MKRMWVADGEGKVSPLVVFTRMFYNCPATTETVVTLHLRSVRLAIPARVVMGT